MERRTERRNFLRRSRMAAREASFSFKSSRSWDSDFPRSPSSRFPVLERSSSSRASRSARLPASRVSRSVRVSWRRSSASIRKSAVWTRSISRSWRSFRAASRDLPKARASLVQTMASAVKTTVTTATKRISHMTGRERTARSMGLWITWVIKIVRNPQAIDELRQI